MYKGPFKKKNEKQNCKKNVTKVTLPRDFLRIGVGLQFGVVGAAAQNDAAQSRS